MDKKQMREAWKKKVVEAASTALGVFILNPELC